MRLGRLGRLDRLRGRGRCTELHRIGRARVSEKRARAHYMSKRAAGAEQATTAATAGEKNIEGSRQSAGMTHIQFEGEYTRKMRKNTEKRGRCG